MRKSEILRLLTILYFTIALGEIIAEYFLYQPALFVLKPLIPIILLFLYWIASENKNTVFILAVLFSVITNILFIPNTDKCLFYGIISFAIFRILSIFLVFKLQKIKDFVPLLIATAPFLLIFSYLFTETPDIPENSVFIIVFQNIMISIFAGVALSSYVMNDNRQNSILFISALLFVMLQFVVFIEKYFLTNEYQQLFRPLAMTFNVFAFYSFYRYVINAEESNNN